MIQTSSLDSYVKNKKNKICEICVNCALVMKCCKVSENNGDEISESNFYLFL